MQFIDSHCHLDCLDLSKPELPDQLSEVVALAKKNAVTAMLCVSLNLENFPKVLAIAKDYDAIYASVGLHPTEQACEEPSVERLLSLAADPNIIAIGETGLDYYWLKDRPEWQRERFRVHIAAANQCQKPLIVHTRNAREDTLAILRSEQAHAGVLHCFTENYAMAKAALDLGFYISFSGIVTFKNAHVLQAVAKKIPLDRMLIETDSPYLTPVPYRGRANQPAYVREVASYLAALRGESLKKIAAAATENFEQLFQVSLPEPF